MADLRETMIVHKIEELDELEKGIVLASVQIDSMVGMGPEADLSTLAGIRRRREHIEEEYVRAKKQLADLRAGNLPDETKADERNKRAKHRLQEANEVKEKLKSKRENAEGELYDPEDGDEKVVMRDIGQTGGQSLAD